MNTSFFENAKTPLNEKDFIARAKSGNMHAYGIVFVQYAEGVFRFFNAQIGDPLTARDLTEEVFFKVWQSFPDYQLGKQSFVSHLYSFAVEVMTDYYRDNNLLPEFNSASPNPVNVSGNLSEPHFTLSSLPVLSRYVLILYVINKISFVDISIILGRTESGIRDIHTQALSMLPQAVPSRTAATAWLIHKTHKIRPAANYLQTSMPRLLKLIKVSEQFKFTKRFELEMVKRKQITKQANRKFAYQIVSTLALVYVFFLGSTGVVFASQGSIPGNPLYSAKLAIEEIQLSITSDPQTTAELHTQFALNRLDELSRLFTENDYSNIDSSFQNLNLHLNSLFSTLGAIDVQNDHLASLLDLLQQSLQTHINTLALNQNKVPDSAAGSLLLAMEKAHHSLDVLTSIFPSDTTTTTIQPPANNEGLGPPDDILIGGGNSGNNNPSSNSQGSDEQESEDIDDDIEEPEEEEEEETEEEEEEETETEEPDDDKNKPKGNGNNNPGKNNGDD